MRRFYPSDLNLCHMVPRTVESKSDSRAEAGGGRGWVSVQTGPSIVHSEGGPIPSSRESVPTKAFQRGKCPGGNL